MIDWKRVIQDCFEQSAVYFTQHAKREMEFEEFGQIFSCETITAIRKLEVIEDYLDDQSYPSALVLGFTEQQRPIHIVCAYDSSADSITVLTVYQPDPARWKDFKFRKL